MQEGKLVGGKYQIGRIIGAGAMGTVVEARDLTLHRKVAIKFLKPDALGHADAIARFFVEAQSAAQVASDHAVRIYAVEKLDDGTPYIVMEYLHGCDLAEWLRRHRTLPVEQAIAFTVQACDAIADAHDRGIIHRDVKPANLFAVDRGDAQPRIKVLDFGISKTDALVSDTLPPGSNVPVSVPTERSAIFGSCPYMSPEQMESARDVDGRTDVWALGVTLWEMLCGELPFRAGSIVALHSMIVSGVRPRLRSHRPDAPAELEAVLQRCLATKRDGRYASVRELAAALAPFGPPIPSSHSQRPRRSGVFLRIVTSRWTLRISLGASALLGVALAGTVLRWRATTGMPWKSGVTAAPVPSTQSVHTMAESPAQAPADIPFAAKEAPVGPLHSTAVSPRADGSEVSSGKPGAQAPIAKHITRSKAATSPPPSASAASGAAPPGSVASSPATVPVEFAPSATTQPEDLFGSQR